MYKDEVRPATQAEIAVVEGQVAECKAIETEVGGGMYGTNQKLSQVLLARTRYLEQWLERAAAGKPVFLQGGHVAFQQGALVQAVLSNSAPVDTASDEAGASLKM